MHSGGAALRQCTVPRSGGFCLACVLVSNVYRKFVNPTS
jgi:hypothetical protein